MKGNPVLYKVLVIGVIVLFIGVGIQPAFAEMKNEVMKTSAINSDETWYLANLSMDFGKNITNDRIDYEDIPVRFPGNWTFNVKINFRCPENLKIVVKYEYFISLNDLHLWELVFPDIDIKDTVTIINGSNPPDIDIDYTKFIGHRGGNELLLTLRIKANLTVYEFLDGEWVKTDNDDTFKEIKYRFEMNRIRASERNKNPDDDCNLCAKKVSKSHLVLIEILLNRLERYVNELSVISKQNPIVELKYQEFSKRFFIFKEICKNNMLYRNFPIICTFLFILAVYYGIFFLFTLFVFPIRLYHDFPLLEAIMDVIRALWDSLNCDYWVDALPPD